MEEAYRQHLVNGERAGARYVLNAPRIVPLGAAGDQLAKRAGSSLEFIDRREYQPGDDLRAIDWSGFARSDKLIVKLYRDEVSPHADIILDGSRSMNLEGTRKAEAGARFDRRVCRRLLQRRLLRLGVDRRGRVPPRRKRLLPPFHMGRHRL